MDHRPDRREPDNEKSKVMIWAISGIVLLLVLWFFVAMPAIRGYSTYRAMQASGVPDSYLNDMQGLATENQAVTAARDAAQASLATCQQELSTSSAAWEAEKKGITERATAIEGMLNERTSSLDTCTADNEQMESAIKDAARRICCIQRVEYPAINSYIILEGKIACVTDGGESISC